MATQSMPTDPLPAALREGDASAGICPMSDDVCADCGYRCADAVLVPSPDCPVCRGFGDKLWIGHKDDHAKPAMACSECWRHQNA